MTRFRRQWLVYVLLAVWAILLRLPSVDEPLDNDSGANAYHARLVLRGEPLYSSHHTAHHVPGVYYSYVLSYLLFGDRAEAPKLLLLPWTAAICWIIYGLGQQISPPKTALPAALLYPLLSSQALLKGMTAETELFANLPISAGVLLALVYICHKAPDWQWVWVGLLAGWATLYKVFYVSPLAIAGLGILFSAWVSRGQMRNIQAMFARLGWLLLGCALPWAATAAYFISLGLWKRFWLLFQLGSSYVGDVSGYITNIALPSFVFFPLFMVAFSNFVLLVLSLAGSLRLLRQSLPLNSLERWTALGIFLWLLLALVQAGITGVGFAHYVLLVIPPMSFVAACEVTALQAGWQSKAGRQKTYAGSLAVCALLLGNSLLTNHSVYWHYAAFHLGLEDRTAFLTRPLSAGSIYLRVNKVAEYIEMRTAPDEVVYYWTNDVQFYYLADRRCAIDIIWPYYVEATGPVERIFASKLNYVIVADPNRLATPEWLGEHLEANFHLEATIDGEMVYRRAAKP